MKMKKILFIYPNSTNVAWICSAIPILIGITKKYNFNYKYFDTYKYNKMVSSYNEKETQGGFKSGYKDLFKEELPYERIEQDLQELINNEKFDLVVITSLSEEYEFFMSIWENIELLDKTKIVIGGVHSILKTKEVLNSGYFDLVCTGQAETTLPDILNRIENDEPIDDVKGTYYYNKKTKETKRNSNYKLLPSEELWKTEWDFSIFSDKYFMRPFDNKVVNRYDIEIARGCPYNCNYCGNSALKDSLLNKVDFNNVKIKEKSSNFLTKRPLDSSMEHFKKMVDDFNIDIFQFTDECFLSHSFKWIEDFMIRYSKECGKPFIFQTRPETVTDEKIKMISRFDIPFQVSIGVESGSRRILDICNRKCTNEQISNAFNILHRYKIRTNAFFMVGFPFETREDFFKTVDLCRTIKPSVLSVSILQPMPGQELTNICIENGFISGNEPMATFTSHSILNMPKPYLSGKEIKNMWRTFVLYSTLPKKYYPDIYRCEVDYENNKDLFNKLVEIRWEYDYSKFRHENSLLKFIDENKID